MNVNVQDYGWVKQGMIFPFTQFLDRSVDSLLKFAYLFRENLWASL